jgi:integrase
VEPNEPKAKRPRGTGSIFTNGSKTLWIEVWDRGQRNRENAHTTDYKVADELLNLRLAQIKTQTFTPRTNVKVDELIDDLKAEYREKQQRTGNAIDYRWRLHLAPFFTRRLAADVNTEMVRRYMSLRTEEKASPATINRELAVLKRAFYLGSESTPPKIRQLPHIPMFRERNVRKGFLKDEQYDKLAAECGREGLWLRALLAVAYNFGWRKGELINLRVHQVDLASRTIRLEVGETKNNAGRMVKMPDEVLLLLTALVTGKKGDDYVFTRERGRRVKNFSKLWRTCCKRAEVPDLLFHDLRRSGARNLRRLGIAESIAMKVTGHKTPSIFKRYDICDESDLTDVATRQSEWRRLRDEQKSEVPVAQRPNPEFSSSSLRKEANCTTSATTAAAGVTRQRQTAVLPN